MGRVVLKPGKSRPISCGHPWVFSGAIARDDSRGADFVEVFDETDRSLGWGAYSFHSDIRVRMTRAWAGAPTPERWRDAFERMLKRRRGLGLASARYTGFRLCNSEGDGVPGVIVDRLGDVTSVQLTTAPMFRQTDVIVGALREVFPGTSVLMIPPPAAIAQREKFGVDFGWKGPEGPAELTVVEGRVQYVIATDRVQKTGHYADMRIHREWVGSIAAGRRVLDAYSYSGGFGLHAAQGGADAVTSVDSSADAVAAVARNAQVNGAQIEVVQAKVDDYLRSSLDKGRTFDLIVLDPPKLAPSKKHLAGALKVYESLMVQAARLMDTGILCVGSCSEAIGLAELERLAGSVQARLGRSVSTMYVGTQSPDHPYPSAMPEGRYLTFVAFEVQ